MGTLKHQWGFGMMVRQAVRVEQLKFGSPAPVVSRKTEQAIIRFLDVMLSLFVLAFLLPFMVLVAALIYIANPGPVFIAHRRLGLNGVSFPCFKFRTMVTDAEERLRRLLRENPALRFEWELNHKLRADPRITGVGRFLRSSSIDELPQLFNVLRGEMSLVGPRPIVEGEVARYGRYFRRYCAVRPGITGLWQVSGRNDVSYRRRVALDVAYSRSYSVMLNLRILLMTVPSVLKAQGSY